MLKKKGRQISRAYKSKQGVAISISGKINSKAKGLDKSVILDKRYDLLERFNGQKPVRAQVQ